MPSSSKPRTTCDQVTQSATKIFTQLGAYLTRLPKQYESAAYIPGSFLLGAGEKLCDESGKGLGKLIIETAAPAALEKKNSHGRAVFRIGPPGVGIIGILVTQPEDIKAIMGDKKNIHNHDGVGNFSKFLGRNNILSMPQTDERWKQERDKLGKMLADKKTLQQDIPKIHETIDEIFKQIDQTGTINDIESFTAHYTLKVMGKKLALKEFPKENIEAISNYISSVSVELGNLTGTFQKSFIPFTKQLPYSIQDKIDRHFDPRLYQLIDESNTFIRDKIMTDENIQSIKSSENWLHSSDEKFDADFTTLRDRIVLPLSAGTETTKSLTSNAIATLAMPQHAGILQKLREEIARIKNGDLSKWTLEDYETCPYLNAFLDEVLRFYPSVPVMVAVGKSQYEKSFKLEGIELQGGEYFFISPGVTHLLESVWGEDAKKFQPERFLGKNQLKQNPYAYFPFGWLPRICPGQRFAKLEARMLLARLIMQYDFSLEKTLTFPLPYDVIFTMKPKLDDVTLRLTQRQIPQETYQSQLKLKMR